MTDHSEQIREVLNFSGFPFQHHCADRIARLGGYQVSVEVPFTDPPTNEVRLGTHGSIDIFAARPDKTGEMLMCFIIECKRAKEETKNWILLPNHQQQPRWPTFMFSERAPDHTEIRGVNRGMYFPSLGYSRGGLYDYCVNGIEVNATRTRQNSAQDEKIYKPLRQVAHAVHGYEIAAPKIVEGIEYLRPGNDHRRRLHVPVVITTANIYVPTFDPVDVTSGDILAGALTLGAPRQWATFEFPLPDFMSFQVSRTGGTTSVPKRTIFVVNHLAIDEFFEKALDVEDSDGPPVE